MLKGLRHGGVEAKPSDVEEVAVPEPADIQWNDRVAEGDLEGRFGIRGQVQAARETIAGSGGHQSEHDSRPDHRTGGFVGSAVAAPGDDAVHSVANERPGQLNRVTMVGRDFDVGVDRSGREPRARDALPVDRRCSPSTTGDRVDDHCDAHASPEK